MIRLRLKFKNDDQDLRESPVVVGELLSEAVDRITVELPGEDSRSTLFVAVMNGNIIEPDLWGKVKLKAGDEVLVAPRLQSGDFGQIFKQALIIAITVVASVYLSPAVGGGIYGALAVVGVTIATSLALNALIPPPVGELGSLGGLGDSIESSQMYAVSGQSNQIKRLGVVPKVYGSHRMFPTLACNPYTELSVNPATGEIVQYLCAIYDFGLGSPLISDIRIGDTPLNSDSFDFFQINIVDPNAPDTPTDEYDSRYSKTFSMYKGDRTVTPLSLALTDGSEFTQNTDENPRGFVTEVVVDLVCPRGLYGYSSGGTLGERRIHLILEFALVGSSSWLSYNDLTNVQSFSAVGGLDYTDFRLYSVLFTPDNAAFSTFFDIFPVTIPDEYDPIGRFKNYFAIYAKLGGNKIPLPKPGASDLWSINVGTKVFQSDGVTFLGLVQSVVDRTTYYEITLDRALPTTYRILVGNCKGTSLVRDGIKTYTEGANVVGTYLLSGHSLGAAQILGSNTNPIYSSFRFTPKVAGQYKVRLRRVSTDGSFSQQKADDLTWGALTTNFKSMPVLTTKRHTFLELKIQATDQLNGTVQNLSAIVEQPVDVYDRDTETWSRQVTNNPAWIFCDLLTGEVNKKAVSKDRLHMESILAWADYCDEIPDAPPGYTFKEPRFKCNFILDYASTLQGVLNSVAGAAQASLNIIDGKYGVLVDRLKTLPTQIFTPRNSSQFSSNRFYAPRPHGLKVKYIDPNLAWEVSEAVAYDNGYDVTNATEFEEMTSFACTNYEQAWRFGRYMLAQNRLRQETISILVDFENLICTRGDYVQISQDVMQVGGRPARVNLVEGHTIHIDDGLDIDPAITDWGFTFRSSTGEIFTSTLTPLTPRTFALDGDDIPEVGDLIIIGEVGQLVVDCIVRSIAPNDDMSAQLTLVERANEIFDYESSSTIPDYDPQISNTFGLDIKPPSVISNLTLEENTWRCSDTKSGYDYIASVSWDLPAGSVYEHFEIWYNNGAGYRAIDTTTVKSYTVVLDQARIGSQMGIKVVAVSASGKKLNPVDMPEVTFTPVLKTTPPSDVEGFAISITQQVLQLSWDPIDDCDVFKYEVRFSPNTTDTWLSSIPLQTVDRNVNSLAVQARTGIYLIKAVDFAGNRSFTASTNITTIPNLFELNSIEVLNDAPDFLGEHDRVEFQGEALILQERVVGDQNSMEYYSDGYYTVRDLVDVDDIYSTRLQSTIRAAGYAFSDLMLYWDPLSELPFMASAGPEDWNAVVEYRATSEILAMSGWVHLTDIDHIGEGAEDGFTGWRPVPTIGDATGRVFQFRVHLQSFKANVTPRLIDATITVDMPDRIDSLENLISSATLTKLVTYSYPFAGPGTSPNIQISIQNGSSGDYWTFDSKNLEGFEIRFYDKTNTQVARIFDVAAKGYGRRNAVTI